MQQFMPGTTWSDASDVRPRSSRPHRAQPARCGTPARRRHHRRRSGV